MAKRLKITLIFITALLVMPSVNLYSQERETPKGYRVEGGQKQGETRNPADTVSTDTTAKKAPPKPIVTRESLRYDSLGRLLPADSAKLLEIEKRELDSLKATFNKRQLKKYEKAERYADTSFVRHNRIFRDSIPISRVTAISLVVPGYSQLYNSQAWKIPILYGTVGLATTFAVREHKTYSGYKKDYDYMRSRPNEFTQEDISPTQKKMIQSNTRRQLYMAGALVSYIYFIGDGAVNYPGATTSVKKATTLSTIFPGAGQIYNRSYWKAPIVIGGFATMAYVIDWNNRGYQRFKTAYNALTDGNDETVDEFNGRYSADFLRNLRNNYRRNRDLCIIMTAGLYLLNVIDAHVDAHLKDYDVSDDLSMWIEPSITQFYAMQHRGSSNMMGFSFKINF